jgi:hypothetical protein
MSSDTTVGLEEKCQSGVHRSSGGTACKLEGRHEEVLKRNASRVSSDATVGLEEKCQSGIHKSSGVINRLLTRGTPRKGLENKVECPG